MMNFNTRTKSVVLALAIAASTSNSFCIKAPNFFESVGSYAVTNKKTIALCGVVSFLAFLKICLETQQRVQYTYDDVTGDIKEFCGAYNIFDAESRATIKHFFKKYLVGAKIKIDEVTIRTKEEDGSVIALKRNKLTQIPSGFMGLLDAYLFETAKKVTDVVPAMVALYILIKTPEEALKIAVDKANKV